MTLSATVSRATAHLGPVDLTSSDFDAVPNASRTPVDQPVGPDGFVSESRRGELFEPIGGGQR